ncbi:conjugative transfer relaxase/helicase TraI [Lelliottia nimipressuralis]|uniref:Conjugative transfer relaxase/helicase TraI n=1 Tax=Lelliottia nimipressuralis TaxID=69220 RepID=A0ABD4KEP5_9ENTR|nr:conjugative transfer relaxase/helicase TraI [Lelliottia nimipressuralis]MBF4180368.1 conjugative transfer relaxase/helicase TraI [Lelliottia nimipressuralis]
MLSVSPIKGDAGYYGKEDNYYVSGALDDRWLGKGAEKLGLEGRVDATTLDAVMAGKLPDGSDLTRMSGDKNTHRAGYDLTFSAPKGVSMAILIGGDKKLLDAHNRAVEITMREVESLVTARLTENGKTETVSTGTMVAALFNHDTSRDLEPQIHTHALVLNATFTEGKWRSLASDPKLKTGFSEAVYGNKIAIGNIYRTVLRDDISKMGFETVEAGPHGLWDLKDVPTEEFSSRSTAIREAAGPDASAKSLDMAALDTRKPKSWADAELLVKSWETRLQKRDFDMKDYVAHAAVRAGQPGVVTEAPERGSDVALAVSEAVSALSDKKVQFTMSELLSCTVNRLPSLPGVFEQARAGIDQAIEQQRLIPLDREKGIFTSDIHLLNELSVQQLAQTMMREQRTEVFPDRSVARTDIASDAVSVLAQDRSPLALMSGKGGAQVQRERIADVAQMAREQGREVMVLASDRRSGVFLEQDAQLEGRLMHRTGLNADTVFQAHSTLIVEQAEKLTLKETLLVLEKGQAANAQVVFMDAQNRAGTGNALSVLKESDVPQYRFYGGKQPEVTLVSEPDKRTRFGEVARLYVEAGQQGRDVVAQVDGPVEQKTLIDAIREARREAGEIGAVDTKLSVIEPVWLDSKTRRQRDNYRPGMVMEQWSSEKREMTRYSIDRVADKTNSLVLVSEAGERLVQKISKLDGSWSLFRAKTLDVAQGDELRTLGREAKGSIKAGERYTVQSTDEGKLVLQSGERSVELDTSRALKLSHDYVESVGSSVSSDRQVLALLPGQRLTADSLTRLSRSGSDIHVFTPLERSRAEKRVLASPVVRLASERVMDSVDAADLSGAVEARREQLMSPAEQAVSLAVPLAQNGKIQMSRVDLLSRALSSGVPFADVSAEIQRQTESGDLIHLPVVSGAGTDVLVPRVAYEMEKTIIRTIAEGKDAVSPLMEAVPVGVLKGLTQGQTAATKLILESTDRFLGVQGYAGVGKTTQYRAVMRAIGTLPKDKRPIVIGLGPTHRAVKEMRDAGVPAQTLASFLSEHRQALLSDEKPDFSNTLFLTDESSMIGNRDMAELHQIVAAGHGRMVSSGDEAQLQPIAAGTPFRLMQQRSAADVAIMQEIVRQTPELRPAVESVIAGKVTESLERVVAISPAMVPRKTGAWVPEQSVMEFKREKPEDGTAKEISAEANVTDRTEPTSAIEAIISDWRGRTRAAQEQTLVVAQLNADRRAINEGIHQARREDGHIGQEERYLSVLSPVRVPENTLRSAEGFAQYTGKTAMLNQQYYTISSTDTKSGVVFFRDRDGNEIMISPQENTAQDISVYETRTLAVSEGDKVLFNRTDTERGYVANDVWTVTGFADKGGIRFGRDGEEKLLYPGTEDADRHIDLAYAVTVNGSQGASAKLVIGLAGIEGGRKMMASMESWYVTLSRSVMHMQTYTDDTAGWVKRIEGAEKRLTAHDMLNQQGDAKAGTASWLLENAVSLEKTGLGRQVLNTAQLAGETMASFIAPGKKYPAPYMALPVWNQYGKERGVLLTEIRLSDEGRRLQLGDEHRLMGAEDARFAGLQSSRNGETLQADDLAQALQLARENPESGVIIRLGGDESLLNAQRLTGGRVEESEPVVVPVTEEEPLPLLPEKDVTGHTDSEHAVRQVAQELQQDPLFGFIQKSDLVNIVPGEKQTPDIRVDIADHKIQQAIEQVAAELGGKSGRDVTHRLQQQEREWGPEQEHSLEKTFGE